MKKALFVFIFLLTIPAISFAEKKDARLFAYNSFGELLKKDRLKSESIIIFSSRDYVTELFSSKLKFKTIYWVIPVDELKPEDANIFLEHISQFFKLEDLTLKSEGMYFKIGERECYIVLKDDISKIFEEDAQIIVDVDFFFRLFKNEVKTPKMESVIALFQSFNDYEWRPREIFIVKSLDISLPHWVQEFAYAIDRVYKSWNKGIFPKDLLALDFVDQAANIFAQHDEAYQILKEIENLQKDNPFFYERLFWIALKVFNDSDVLMSAKRAYELDRQMINLYFQGTDYLLSKTEIYPAYILINEALNLEPWNTKIRDKIKEVVELGYNYYNQHEGEEELFNFFKKEREKNLKGEK